MVKISPEWVIGPEQGTSSGRIASGPACFAMEIPPFLMKELYSSDSVVIPRLSEQGIPGEGEDDCWVGQAIVLHSTTPYTPAVLPRMRVY